MQFTGELTSHGGTKAGFVVPEEVVDGLGGGRRPKVTVTVDGYTWRSSIAYMGGQFLLGVSNDHRARSGLAPGQTYAVDLALDTEPRVVEVPDDLAAALDGTPGARAAWDKLAYTHQREHADAIEGAKKAETRVSRIDKCLAMLTGR